MQKATYQIITIFILIFFFHTSFGQGSIQGIVKDKKSGETIVGAHVRINGTTLGAATNLDGSMPFIISRREPMRLCAHLSLTRPLRYRA
jgi:hypothetical protein